MRICSIIFFTLESWFAEFSIRLGVSVEFKFTCQPWPSHKQKKFIFLDVYFKGCYFKCKHATAMRQTCLFEYVLKKLTRKYPLFYARYHEKCIRKATPQSVNDKIVWKDEFFFAAEKQWKYVSTKKHHSLETRIHIQKPLNYNFPSSKRQLPSYQMIHLVIPKIKFLSK